MHIILKTIEGIPILGGMAIAVVGLFAPHLVLFWAKRQTRVGAIAFGVCVTLLGAGLVSMIDKFEFGPFFAFVVLMALLVGALMTDPKKSSE